MPFVRRRYARRPGYLAPRRRALRAKRATGNARLLRSLGVPRGISAAGASSSRSQASVILRQVMDIPWLSAGTATGLLARANLTTLVQAFFANPAPWGDFPATVASPVLATYIAAFERLAVPWITVEFIPNEFAVSDTSSKLISTIGFDPQGYTALPGPNADFVNYVMRSVPGSSYVAGSAPLRCTVSGYQQSKLLDMPFWQNSSTASNAFYFPSTNQVAGSVVVASSTLGPMVAPGAIPARAGRYIITAKFMFRGSKVA